MGRKRPTSPLPNAPPIIWRMVGGGSGAKEGGALHGGEVTKGIRKAGWGRDACVEEGRAGSRFRRV